MSSEKQTKQSGQDGQKGRQALSGLVIAFASFTRIPMPRVEWSRENRQTAMCFFPLIGVLVGLLETVWLFLCDKAGFGGILQGAVAAVLPLLLTGGIHMDGMMDVTDAMASWQTQERRREILKDSHVGAFAVMACAGYLLVQVGCFSELSALDGRMLIASMVLSRACSAYALAAWQAVPGTLQDTAEQSEKKLVRRTSLIWCVLAVLLAVSQAWWGVFLPVAAGLSLAWYRYRARKYFGGISGDQAGWYVQVAELLCLLVITAGSVCA